MRRALLALSTLTLIGPLAAAATPLVAHAATCTAQAAGGYPNDPGYAPAENGQPGGPTWDSEAWYLYGCIPQDVASTSSDPEGASGMSVDSLWNRSPNPQRGSDQVTVAYMEGGVNWRISGSCELKDRAALNTGELPFPQDANGVSHNTYDLNGDGVVNVEDYFNDPRVRAAVAALGDPAKSPAGGPFLHNVCSKVGTVSTTGYAKTDITPEDLIVAFGHCQIVAGQITNATLVGGVQQCTSTAHFDNDHNGYPNDINGWNFNRDNNDPQTEQSVYEHFTGESAQLVGEGNNSFGNIGMCPLCRYVPIKAGDEAIDRPDRVAEAIVYAANLGVNVMDVTSATLGLNQNVQAAINYAYDVKNMVVVFASNDFESADHTDGNFYAHVWPGNSLTGDHSTRGGTTCPVPPTNSSQQVYCPFVLSNTTFRSRSSLTSYGPHSLFSVPNPDGSTSTGTPTQAGVAALMMSEGVAAVARHQISPFNATSALSADEVKQVVRSTSSPIDSPCPAAEPCFHGPGSGASFNIMYGYGRPNVLAGANAIDAGHIPPTAEIVSPNWYQEVDPTTQSSLQVSAAVAAQRANGGAYTWQLQYAAGPQPFDNAWTTFQTGNASGPQTVAGSIDLSQIPASFWNAAYSIDPQTRLSIEQYDVSIRVQVFAGGDTSDAYSMGEDRRVFHLHHDPTIVTGTPLYLGSSGDASPTMSDIEGRGWLDTIVPTSDGTVHAFRPDGTEAPGFPVHTNPAPGMDATPGHNGGANYLSDPTWGNNVLPRPRDPIFSTAAVGDLHHTGALDIVVGTASGYTYAWDGTGSLLPGFPVLNGVPANFGLTVPPPDTAYSFEPENYTAASPVLAHLIQGSSELDIIQAAGDNQIHAWRPDGSAVPGWPVSTHLPPSAVTGQLTHDSKTVPTPAVIDINGDGIPDVVVGLDDSILGSGPAGAGVQTFLMAYDGRGTNANGPVAGNPALLSGYPVKIQGLLQGYGVAQDFVTQGVESPAVYTDPTGNPQAVVNANLFLPFRVDLKNPGNPPTPFAATTISPPSSTSCPTPNSAPPVFPSQCTLAQFTTSASLGKVLLGSQTPQAFQMGSAATDVFLGITQVPGFGIRVDNGVGGWDPTTGASLSQYSNYIQGLAFFAAPAIADVNGDGIPDIIIPADSGALMAFSGATGQPVAGFPKWTGGWSVFTPAVGDIKGNGQTDVAAATREGYVFIWSSGGSACTGNNEAWHWHQNDWNSGAYGADTRPPSAISDLTVTKQGQNDVLTFTAVGDNWKCGTAAGYQLFTAPGVITQQNVSQATPITVAQTPGPAGTKETITIPASQNQGALAIRAVDAAGNIGPIVVGVAPAGNTPEFGLGAVSAMIAALLVVGLVIGPRRLRRAKSG